MKMLLTMPKYITPLVGEPLVRCVKRIRADAPFGCRASFEDVLERANVLVLLTNHAQFSGVHPEQLSGKIVIDPRRTWRGKQSASCEEGVLPFPFTKVEQCQVA
jgi:UDP-N-acetyl-D-mannosaminuronate dehydrogenase